MKIVKKMLHGFNRYITYTSRSRVRAELLRSSDRMLEDSGFSRELLESGVAAWPWHAPAETVGPVDNITAMRELQSYNDRDLNDPGISRRAIPESVVFGREGIEWNNERKVA